MANTTNKELKLVISATDPEFQKVIKGVNKALQSLSKTTQQTAAQTGASLNKMATQAKRASDKTATAITRSSKRSNRALKLLQRGLFNVRQGIITLVAAGGAASITKFAGDFELALANVNTLLPESGVKIERYREQLIALSKVSSKEVIDLTKGLYQTISAGIPAVEGASGAFSVLERAQAAAVAGLSTTEQSVNAIVSVVNAYGRTNITAAEASDKLLKTVQLGRTTFPELARAIGRVAPTAAAFNISADDMFASLIQLTRAGLNTNEAVTGLRNLIKSLTQPTQETQKVLETLNKASGKTAVSLTATALRANGLQGQMQLLTDATGGSVEVLGRLFPNIRATLPAIVQVGERAEETAGFMDQLAKSAGTVDAAVAKVSPTFSEVFKVTKSVFQSAFIDAGERVIPLLIERMKGLQRSVEENSNSFSRAFKGAIEATDTVIKVFISTLKVLGTILDGLTTKAGMVASGMLAIVTLLQPAIAKLATAMVGAGALAGRSFTTGFISTIGPAFLAVGPMMQAALVAGVAGVGYAIWSVIYDEMVADPRLEEATTEAVRQATEELRAIRTAGFEGFQEFRQLQAELAKGAKVQLDTETIRSVELRLRPDDTDVMTVALQELISGEKVSVTAEFKSNVEELKKTEDQIRALQVSLNAAKNSGDEAAKALTIPALNNQLDELIEKQGGLTDAVLSTVQASADLDSALKGELGRANEAALKSFQSLVRTQREGVVSVQEFIKNETNARIQQGAEKEEAASQARVLAIELWSQKTEEAYKKVEAAQDSLNDVVKRRLELQKKLEGEGVAASQAKADAEATFSKELGDINGQLQGSLKVRYESLKATRDQLKLDNDRLKAQEEIATAAELERQRQEAARKAAAARAKIENAALRFLRLTQRIRKDLRLEDEKRLKSDVSRTKALIQANAQEQKRAKTAKDFIESVRDESELRADLADQEERLALAEQDRKTQDAEALRDQAIADLERSAKIGEISSTELAESRALAEKRATMEIALAQEAAAVKIHNTRLRLQSELAANELAIIMRNAKVRAEAREAREKAEESLRQKMGAFEAHQAEEEKRRIQAFIAADERRRAAASEIGDILQKGADEYIRQLYLGIRGVSEEAKTLEILRAADIVRLEGAARGTKKLLGAAFNEAKGGGLAIERSILASVKALAQTSPEHAKIGKTYEDMVEDLGDVASPSVIANLQKMFASDLLGAAGRHLQDNLAAGGKAFGGFLLESVRGGLTAIEVGVKRMVAPMAEAASLIGLDFVASGESLKSSILSAGSALTDQIEAGSTALAMSLERGVADMLKSGAIDLGDSEAAQQIEAALADGGEGVATGISHALRGGASVLTHAFKGFVSLLAKTLDAVLTPITKALQAPIDMIFGSLGDALDVITRTKKEEREERGKRLALLKEEFEVRLSEAQAAGATNEEIARLQSQFAQEREKIEVEEETPEGAMSAAFDKALEIAKELMVKLPQLLQSFITQLVLAIPQIVPALVTALAETIKVLGENLGDILVTTINAVVDSLPVLVDALAESLDDILIGLLDGITTLVERLPEIVDTLIQGIIKALPKLVTALVTMIPKLVTAVIAAIPDIIASLIEALPRIWLELQLAIPRIIYHLILEIPSIIKALVYGMGDVAKAIVTGIGDGLDMVINQIFDPIVEFFKKLTLDSIADETTKGLGDALDFAVGERGGSLGERTFGGGVGRALDNPYARVGVAGLTLGLSEGARLLSSWTEMFHEGGAVASGMRDKATAKMFRDLGAAGFQSGGLVTAAASGIRASAMDDVPAILQTGEGVLSRVGMRAAGGERGLDRLNAGQPAAGDVNVSLGIVPNSGGLAAAAAALLPMLISGVVSEINSGTGPLTTAMDGQRAALLGYAPVPGKG